MQNKPIIIWTWISLIMTFFMGSIFFLNPGNMFPPEMTAAEMARFVGIKNMVYAVLMLYAVLKKSKLLLIVLLLGRGAQDIIDGVTGLSMGYIVPPFFAATISGIITLVAGLFLAKTKDSGSAAS